MTHATPERCPNVAATGPWEIDPDCPDCQRLVESLERLELEDHRRAERVVAEEMRAAVLRVEGKLDKLLEVFEEYRPLLEEAATRLGKRPRFMGGARGGNRSGE